MSVLWIIATGIVIAVLYILLEIRKIGTPTTGPKINLASRPETALLVIDMQTDFTSMSAWDDAQIEGALSAIRSMTDSAHQSRRPVIVIRHEFEGRLANMLNGWFNQGRGNAESDGIGLDPRLALNPDAEFVKSVGDAFSSSVFEQFLEEKQIGTLVLTGLDGCHCVNKTAQGALNRGYRVQIDPAAVLVADPSRWHGIRNQLATAGVDFRPQT
ncbi:cysteine hydrolase [Ruegeria conchae]|uniref:Nicotinamidase-related amidase n=1 Tax=Ruegeria conchae TaxID=981384 RepID=A0A497YUV8_9RHOB|nr:cysteine hydrolase [Ruegeria conchae]RLJ99858.1 nicotinamidase-related amidase [Ruegeria conchae]